MASRLKVSTLVQQLTWYHCIIQTGLIAENHYSAMALHPLLQDKGLLLQTAYKQGVGCNDTLFTTTIYMHGSDEVQIGDCL